MASVIFSRCAGVRVKASSSPVTSSEPSRWMGCSASTVAWSSNSGCQSSRVSATPCMNPYAPTFAVEIFVLVVGIREEIEHWIEGVRIMLKTPDDAVHVPHDQRQDVLGLLGRFKFGSVVQCGSPDLRQP